MSSVTPAGVTDFGETATIIWNLGGGIIGILMNKVKEISQDNSSGLRVSEMSKNNRVVSEQSDDI